MRLVSYSILSFIKSNHKLHCKKQLLFLNAAANNKGCQKINNMKYHITHVEINKQHKNHITHVNN